MTPECPLCKAKFSHNRDLLLCNKCGLPDEVAAKGDEAIKLWHQQSLINKKLFGAMHARQDRTERRKKLKHPSRHTSAKAPVGVYRKLARLKRDGGT